MKRFLALLITFAMLLSAVPAFADGTPVTVTSTFNNAAGVPVNATIPLTFSDAISSLDASAITVTPSINGAVTVSGEGMDWIVKFGANMEYETEYTLAVGSYGNIKFTTQFDYSDAGNTVKPANHETSKLNINASDFTVLIEASVFFNYGKNNNAGVLTYFREFLKDSSNDMSIVFHSQNDAETCYDANKNPIKQNLKFYAMKGSTQTGDVQIFKNINTTGDYIVTVSDYTLYVYYQQVGKTEYDVFSYKLNFDAFKFEEEKFKLDSIGMDNTGVITTYYGSLAKALATSTFNNKKGVPVDTQIPLTYKKVVNLTKEDITVSPKADFELITTDNINYNVKFKDDMAYGTDYSISIKDTEIVNYKTEYNPSSALTAKGSGITHDMSNSTNKFTVEICDVAAWIKAANQDSTANLTLKETEKRYVNFHFTNKKSDGTVKMSVTVAEDNLNMAGYANAYISDTNVQGHSYKISGNGNLKITIEDYVTYVYQKVDSVWTYVGGLDFKTLRNGWTPSSDFKPASAKWGDTGVLSAKISMPTPVSITSCTESNGEINADVAINAALDNNAVLIFAAYTDSNKTLVGAESKKISDAANGKVSFKVNGTATNYKLFVFDSLDELKPIIDAVSGTINK